MPKSPDIQRVLIIGSGPIIIGQACEFDYSGTQACRALREEGIEVVLLNSNPATIMTDPELADRTYLEPITPQVLDEILRLEAERGAPVDSILPTLGGQTGLNCAMAAHEGGILAKHGVRLIGADVDTIRRAEDREIFKRTVVKVGVDVPRSGTVTTWEEAQQLLETVPLPVVIRPAFTLGGTGGGRARNLEEFQAIVCNGLDQSPVRQVLIEEDLTGWKEFELEMMRDRNDNVVVVCSIENFDPMGVHTGDSITVAPALTLTDKEYQRMRDAAIAIMRAVGVDTGGSNIQFAVNPRDGHLVVIEMNPRVSRSSALASKATGFPIAKIATKLAIGYTLDELRNDITRVTSACFEPSIDYCVVKMPRFAFEKFPEADETLTTSMKSVGEAMAIGRTFKEAFQKCIRSMEIKRPGYGLHPQDKWWEARQHEALAADEDPDTVYLDPFGEEAPGKPPVFGGTTLGEAPGDVYEEAWGAWPIPEAVLVKKISTPCQGRLYYLRYALKLGWSVEKLHELSHIDIWFLDQLAELVDLEARLLRAPLGNHAPVRATPEIAELFFEAKAAGYSDVQLRHVWRLDAASYRALKVQLDRPKFKLVDTCAAEFEAYTPYYYSTHERPLAHVVRSPAAVEELRERQATRSKTAVGEALRQLGVDAPYRYRALDAEHVLVESHDDELRVSSRPKVIILGGGPNRIGQGIEFDYCCVHAAMAARDMGYETVMVNSNPETVSTDYDVSDLLFFEPLTQEDVLNICERLNGRAFGVNGKNAGFVRGVIVQYGGQTPLNLAQGLSDAGVPILGTSPGSIHTAEDRERFQQVVQELGLRQPPNGVAFSRAQAAEVADRLGYPVLVRPSYVLGGRGMQVCNNAADLVRYIDGALRATDREMNIDEQHPILIEKFLLDAIEVDVDAISDHGYPGRDAAEGRCDICGIMEHIEEAGIHSGDSCCVLPPYSLSPALVDEIKYQVKLLARRLGVCGLMNVQFAIQGHVVYLIEVNPRASRTIPFVSKATGVPWAKVATQVMLGKALDEALGDLGLRDVPTPRHVSVKAPVFPFKKLGTVDFVLGPEMRSTGEVMGIDATYPLAFAKALAGAGLKLPTSGRVLVSVCDPDKPRVVTIARALHDLGFEIFSTIRTHETLASHGVPSQIVSKHDGAGHPFLLDMIRARQLDLLINTPIHTGSATEEGRWRVASIQLGIPLITTLAGARAAVGAIRALRSGGMQAGALQDYLAAGGVR
ncbi:MAG: carbamoyl-phosphate synthase large subunit [Phycisphaerales bacterium]|nr:carbamoyl-phosphate synthase large subunit [Phycisphaerales bacterium]